MMKLNETSVKTEALEDRGALEPISAIAVLACAWPALLLATVCLLPFLNKPFIIDDPHFLAMAQQIIKHPAHPMDFTICWNLGPDCIKAYALTPGNALMGYFLVPTILTGAHEWTAHLTQLVLVWIAILAMTSLVLRFGWDRRHAIIGALLLVAIAPFLPMASTAMPDILATAVALVAMERLAAWKAEQKWTQGAAAAIALGLAGFARAHLPLLLPLAAFYLLDSVNPKEAFAQVRKRFWLWIPVLAGAGLLFAIIATTREHNLALYPVANFRGLRIYTGQSRCLFAVPRHSSASCRLLDGEPVEEQISASRNPPDRGGGRRLVRTLLWGIATCHGVSGYWAGCADRFVL